MLANFAAQLARILESERLFKRRFGTLNYKPSPIEAGALSFMTQSQEGGSPFGTGFSNRRFWLALMGWP
jgi:hypothetical protein